jgi:hypothetical protein
MVQLFAHHGGPLMEALDFLHLEPVTPLQHVVAFASYGLLFAVVAIALFGLTGFGAVIWHRLGGRRSRAGES